MAKSPGSKQRGRTADAAAGPSGTAAERKRKVTPKKIAPKKAGKIPAAGKTKAGPKGGAGTPPTPDAPAEALPAAKKAPSGKKTRLPPRRAFLVAATLQGGAGTPALRVYATVVRSAEAALAAVRAEVGEDAAVELTGSLSTRMARTLGLKPDETRQI